MLAFLEDGEGRKCVDICHVVKYGEYLLLSQRGISLKIKPWLSQEINTNYSGRCIHILVWSKCMNCSSGRTKCPLLMAIFSFSPSCTMLYDEENVTYSPESKLLINVPLGNMSLCAKDFCWSLGVTVMRLRGHMEPGPPSPWGEIKLLVIQSVYLSQHSFVAYGVIPPGWKLYNPILAMRSMQINIQNLTDYIFSGTNLPDRPPDHVCHRFLPNFQVGTRFQLERFEKSLVYPFREVPTNLKNKNYDINQFCFPYIELMSDPWKNFCHHGANRRASICSKDPDVQPTRYKIFQQSFSSIDFHLAATFHLTTNFTIIQNIIQSYF